MKKKRSTRVSNAVIDAIVYFIAIFSIAVCLVPFFNVIAISLSSNRAILSNEVFIYPVEFHLEYYLNVVTDAKMIHSFFYTVKLTFIYTITSMILTILAAYPLSRKKLKGKNVFLLIIVITMYFKGGLIPSYLLISELGLLNKMWALVLPVAISPFNLIILKTFFITEIPDSLEESANLDGCSEAGILLRIVLPLSKPILAVLCLFYAVFRWNVFMDAFFYISDSKLYTLQQKLYQIVNNNMTTSGVMEDINTDIINPEGLKSASVMFVTLPILLVYPWLQKYFVKGVMIGAIKG